MPKLTLPVAGLHCRACEILSEQRLSQLKNVTKVKVNHRSGLAEINYEGAEPSREEIDENLKAIGYKLADGTPPEKKDNHWISILLGVAILYLLMSRFNLFDFSSLINQEFSWPLALLVGLVAGISTCLALVGGLVLGLAANYSKDHPTATRQQKFKPHLLFNFGRLAGFFLLGGLLGLIGSILKPTPFFNGLLTVIVALVLLLLGLKLLEIFPAINRFEFALPKSWGRKVRANNPILLGALTFFLPCGFTQAMQIYALGSGSFFTGGLIMALFALGTAPGLLGIGGLTSLIKGKNAKTFFKIAGGFVILFALINLNNGLKLIKVSGNYAASQNKQIMEAPKENSEVQIIRMTESGRGYTPNQLTVVNGRPVRWIIDAKAPYSCASSLIVPSLKISKQLKPGENIIEFTPTKSGVIPFSCSMGMYTGTITVIEK